MGRDDGVKMSQEKGVGALGLGRAVGAHVPSINGERMNA
jgi:hypothetical protein